MNLETIQFREAIHADLPAIVNMLADDPLGAQRENNSQPLPHSYYEAFAAIDADPNDGNPRTGGAYERD